MTVFDLTLDNFRAQRCTKLILRYVIDLTNVYDILKGKIAEICGKNMPAGWSHPGGTKITLQRGASALLLSAS